MLNKLKKNLAVTDPDLMWNTQIIQEKIGEKRPIQLAQSSIRENHCSLSRYVRLDSVNLTFPVEELFILTNYIPTAIRWINTAGGETKRNWLSAFYIFNICRKKVRIYTVCRCKRSMLLFNSWSTVPVKSGLSLGLNKGYEKLHREDIITVEKSPL